MGQTNISFDVNNVKNLREDIGDKKDLWFLITSFYQALGKTDLMSKYFNLFIIIEYIEQNSSHESVNTKLYDKDQLKKLTENISKVIDDSSTNFENNKINDRIKSILSSATKESRHEKLYNILTESLNILEFKIGSEHKKVSKEFVKKIIDKRNKLFHAKNFNNEEIKELEDLSNYLLFLCGVIINKLIDKSKPKLENTSTLNI